MQWLRKAVAIGTLAAIAHITSASAAIADELQEACASKAESLDQVLACLKAAGRGGSLTDQGCEFAQRGPFTAPVQGRTVVRFGERTQFGSVSKGVVLEVQSPAPVLAPKDGTILYAGEFRSFGKLLVLDVGCSLHFVMAGFATLSVAGGDVVTGGQTIGAMSAAAPAQFQPVLYVELRKAGNAVDPGPDISGP